MLYPKLCAGDFSHFFTSFMHLWVQLLLLLLLHFFTPFFPFDLWDCYTLLQRSFNRRELRNRILELSFSNLTTIPIVILIIFRVTFHSIKSLPMKAWRHFYFIIPKDSMEATITTLLKKLTCGTQIECVIFKWPKIHETTKKHAE